MNSDDGIFCWLLFVTIGACLTCCLLIAFELLLIRKGEIMSGGFFLKMLAVVVVASTAGVGSTWAKKTPRRASKVDNIKLVEKRHAKDEFKIVNKPRYGKHKIIVYNPNWAPRLKYRDRWQYKPTYNTHLGILQALYSDPNRGRMKIAVSPVPEVQDMQYVDMKLQQLQNDYVMVTYY